MKLCDENKLKNAIREYVNEYGHIEGMTITKFNIMLERSRVKAEPCETWILDESKGETKKRKEDDNNLISNRKCSECLHAQNITGLRNYCHDCGVKMDEERKDAKIS